MTHLTAPAPISTDHQSPIRLLSAPVGDLSWLSHELRTPLTSLKGALDLLVSGAIGPLPPILAPVLAIAHRNSNRLADAVEDLIRIGQPFKTVVAITRRRTNLALLTRNVISATRQRGNIAKHSIILTNQARNPVILADPHCLKRAIHRLLDNANRAAAPNTPVTVSLRWTEAHLRLSFRHHGPATAETSEPNDGRSLGLAVAQTIIAAHGGTLFHAPETAGTHAWHVDFPQLSASPAGEPPVAS